MTRSSAGTSEIGGIGQPSSAARARPNSSDEPGASPSRLPDADWHCIRPRSRRGLRDCPAAAPTGSPTRTTFAVPLGAHIATPPVFKTGGVLLRPPSCHGGLSRRLVSRADQPGPRKSLQTYLIVDALPGPGPSLWDSVDGSDVSEMCPRPRLLLAGTAAGLIGSASGITSLASYPALLAVGLPTPSANVANNVALVGSGPDPAARSSTSRPSPPSREATREQWTRCRTTRAKAGSCR